MALLLTEYFSQVYFLVERNQTKKWSLSQRTGIHVRPKQWSFPLL